MRRTVGWATPDGSNFGFTICACTAEGELYVSGYEAEHSKVGARAVRAWASGREPEVMSAVCTDLYAGQRRAMCFLLRYIMSK